MSRANSPPNPETTHLVSLVLHSKKALHHGEQLCAEAHELMRTASALGTDVLALDAKVCWVSQGVQEQLKVGFPSPSVQPFLTACTAKAGYERIAEYRDAVE